MVATPDGCQGYRIRLPWHPFPVAGRGSSGLPAGASCGRSSGLAAGASCGRWLPSMTDRRRPSRRSTSAMSRCMASMVTASWAVLAVVVSSVRSTSAAAEVRKRSATAVSRACRTRRRVAESSSFRRRHSWRWRRRVSERTVSWGISPGGRREIYAVGLDDAAGGSRGSRSGGSWGEVAVGRSRGDAGDGPRCGRTWVGERPRRCAGFGARQPDDGRVPGRPVARPGVFDEQGQMADEGGVPAALGADVVEETHDGKAVLARGEAGEGGGAIGSAPMVCGPAAAAGRVAAAGRPRRLRFGYGVLHGVTRPTRGAEAIRRRSPYAVLTPKNRCAWLTAVANGSIFPEQHSGNFGKAQWSARLPRDVERGCLSGRPFSFSDMRIDKKNAVGLESSCAYRVGATERQGLWATVRRWLCQESGLADQRPRGSAARGP